MIVKVLLIVVALLSIGFFGFPLIRGVVNIGDVTGLIWGILLLLAVIFSDRIMTNGNSGLLKAVYCTTAGLIALVAVLCAVTSFFVFRGAHTKPSDKAVVIVLGCRVNGEKPGIMLETRIDAAERYLKEHEDAVCILSGGKGSDEGISEAECMYRTLVSRGIDGARLYREDRSTSTIENLKFSKEILEAEGLGNNIALVTNEFHEYRAGKIAEKEGLESGAIPADSVWWLLPTYVLREMYAVLVQWCK